ncbi:MAG: hypothetical protein ACXACG_08345 [Candidatus Thorarchaeota archaeon]
MSHKGWRNAGIIILTGLLILVISVILYYIGDTTTLSIFASFLVPLVAFFLGVVGLNAFGRESLVKDDRFHSLNVWMALGLVVFSLSEIAGVIMHLLEGTDEILFTIGLVQLPALLLWGLGALGYLRSSNSALGSSDGDRMWAGVILIASIVGLGLVVVETLFIPGRSLLYTGISVPMVVGLGIILFALGRLLWTLRNGLIARPLMLMFLGVLLYFIRNLFWSFTTYAPGSPFDYITAIESYVLIGASLMAASRLEDVYEVTEVVEE